MSRLSRVRRRVLRGVVRKALNKVPAENARSLPAPIVVTAHRSSGCEMRSLGSFAMVHDPPQFPPSPAQIAARSYAFDD